MCFRVVADYYRREHFDYFRAYRTPFYDTTVDFDITELRAFARRHGYRLYLNLCYFFTRAAASVDDFRYRYRDGSIVCYERLHPGLTVPAPGGRYSYANPRYDDDCARFNQQAEAVITAASQAVTLDEAEHSNYLFFTALPDVPFTAFGHAPSNETTEGQPKVAFGQFREQDGRWHMPTSIQVNHAFIDGRALGALVRAVQHAFDHPG